MTLSLFIFGSFFTKSHKSYAKKHNKSHINTPKIAHLKKVSQRIKIFKKNLLRLQKLQTHANSPHSTRMTKAKIIKLEKQISFMNHLVRDYFQNTSPSDQALRYRKTHRGLVYSLLKEAPTSIYTIVNQKICLHPSWRISLALAWQSHKKWSKAITHLKQAIICHGPKKLWQDIAKLYKQMKAKKLSQQAMERYQNSINQSYQP